MTKAIVVISRRQDMDPDSFRRYWLERHAPIASKLPGLRRYTQNHMGVMEAQGDKPCDGLEEFEFESPEALQTAMASDAAVSALSDLENFADMRRTGLLYVEEVPVDIESRAP